MRVPIQFQFAILFALLLKSCVAQEPAPAPLIPSPSQELVPVPHSELSPEPHSPSIPQESFEIGHNYTCVFLAGPKMECTDVNGHHHEFVEEEDQLEVGSVVWWMYLLCALILILFTGLMSGLNIGLFGLDLMNLQILLNSGSPTERKYTQKILPICKRHHLLLVTILLCTAGCAEALPIVLHKIVPDYVAILLSVTLILFFGEIIPQAICARHALAVGYYLHWLLWFLIGLLFIIAFPISKILDWVMGTETMTFYRKAELKELVNQHARAMEEGKATDGQGPLTEDEVRIIHGALNMREKKCDSKVYTPLSKVFSLPLDALVDLPLLKKIKDSRHSRIPVYRKNPNHVIGILLVKDLLTLPVAQKRIDELELMQIPQVTAEIPLYTLLNQFKAGHSHMALVLNPLDHVTTLGIVTLEDVIEQLLESEILDEADLIRKGNEEDVLRRLRMSIDMGPVKSRISQSQTTIPKTARDELGNRIKPATTAPAAPTSNGNNGEVLTKQSNFKSTYNESTSNVPPPRRKRNSAKKKRSGDGVVNTKTTKLPKQLIDESPVVTEEDSE